MSNSDFFTVRSGVFRRDSIKMVGKIKDAEDRIVIRYTDGTEGNWMTDDVDGTLAEFRRGLMGDEMLKIVDGPPTEDKPTVTYPDMKTVFDIRGELDSLRNKYDELQWRHERAVERLDELARLRSR